MLTEDEASVLYCCKPGAEHDVRLQGCCVGAKCMAWRWGSIEDDPSGKNPREYPDLRKYHAVDTPRRIIRKGYCGLAGSESAFD